MAILLTSVFKKTPKEYDGAVELLYYKFIAFFKKAHKPYVLAGGKKGLLRLVNTFYDLMENEPQFLSIRSMHPVQMADSRQKLFMFLSGWFGGPNLYWKNYGHPRMRARHMKFPIDNVAAKSWIQCMNKAVDQMSWNEEFKDYAMKSFTDFALHMRNRN